MGNGASGARAARNHGKGKRMKRRTKSSSFKAIGDNYRTIEEVQDGLRVAGLESSNLILAIGMTKSNTWTGKRSFGGKCLHSISAIHPNPYERAISIIARTLAPFDEDDLIPVYGFGDSSTHDTDVFSFRRGDKPFHGFTEVLDKYRDLVSNVKLAGPTSFAPIINKAASIAAAEGQFHVLVIIADGQVTRPSDTPADEFSRHERATMEAIVRASYTPLSIVLIGVGDGPWDLMQEFDDHLPERRFDNFQFVCATDIFKRRPTDLHGAAGKAQREARFALQALMEVPEQYQAIQALGIGRSRFPCKAAKDPPRITKLVRIRSYRHFQHLEDAAEPAAPAYGGGVGAGGGAAPVGSWVCGACTMRNVRTTAVCGTCGTRRAAPAPPRGAGAGSARHGSGGGGAHHGSYGAGGLYAAGGNYPAAGGYPQAGGGGTYAAQEAVGWNCPACTFLNDNRVHTCTACGTPWQDTTAAAAPAAAPVASYAAQPVHHAPAAPAAPAQTAESKREAERLAAELESMRDEVTCAVCLDRRKNVVFQCGHQVCDVCSPTLAKCPICRAKVTTRIKMF